MTKIDMAVEWAVSIANDDSHGYDQIDRWGPDYDCSSLIIQAWENAGVPVKTNGATYTGDMVNVFIKAGFVDVTQTINLATGEGLEKGDVCWKSGHVEMMCSKTQLVGAHISENGTIYADYKGDQNGEEINVTNYYNSPWTKVLRYPGGSSDTSLPSVGVDEVITSNQYLEIDDMKINATYIAQYLLSKGWTLEAVAGILGNMQTESTINPGLWEGRDSGNTSGGFGLVQWTPATKLINWANSNQLDYMDIDTQLKRILWEVENNGGDQWYATSAYPESFEEFTQSTESPEYLASAFLKNYERAGVEKEEQRQSQARYWYTYLSNIDPDIPIAPDEPEPTPTKKKSMSLLMMYLATRGY